jgi:hypothetical protein
MRFRLDIDIANQNFRAIQFTPSGSEASIIFGKGVTSVRVGSAELVLAVDDLDATRDDLIGRRVNVQLGERSVERASACRSRSR